MTVRSLPAALRAATLPDEPDADLLDRFVRGRDAEAFARLVRRHGPMVFGVCRRALGNTPDADDAFQSVWLVLVRRAHTLTSGPVGCWLHGVAVRVAAHARTAAARHAARRRELTDVPDPSRPACAAEVAEAVDAELTRLPEKFRTAVVLCDLEEQSLKAAAAALGVPLGTLASRLARGREMLGRRLRAKGFAPAVLAAVAVPDAVAARAAALPTLPPIDIPRPVLELSQGVVNAMTGRKLKLLGLAVVFGSAVGLLSVGSARPPHDNKYAGLLDPNKGMTNEARLQARLNDYWERLRRDEPDATEAVLELYARPGEAVKLFAEKLKPLAAEKDQARKWIADLGDEKDEVWKRAYAELDALDPAVVFDPDAAMAEAKTPLARRRLAAVMTGVPHPDQLKLPAEATDVRVVKLDGDGYYNLVLTGELGGRPLNASLGVEHRVVEIRRPTWTRALRAVVLLERLATGDRKTDALAVLKAMADGHPDAAPTKRAKLAVQRLTAPPP